MNGNEAETLANAASDGAAEEAGDHSKKEMNFGIAMAPERITIEVLKQLIRDNQEKMTYAFQEFFRLAAGLALLLGEDTVRIFMKRLDDDEKSLLLKYMSSLPYRSLDWQTSVLKTFTDETLRVNSSLGGNPLLSANLSSLIKREEAPAPLKDFP